jgi:hypothetical protein
MMLAMSNEAPGSAEWLRRRKSRSVAIAVGLAVLVVIFYVATLVRLGPNALRRDGPGVPPKVSVPAVDVGACKKAGTC